MAICDSVWLVVFDDYDTYWPKISGFKTREQAIEYFKKVIKDNLGEEITEDNIGMMALAHEYSNGVVYVTSVDVEE